jgi:hypothetical protein
LWNYCNVDGFNELIKNKSEFGVLLGVGYRCNTSLVIDHYSESDNAHSYILIDVGKTFREQVLRWFTLHNIPRIDSVRLMIMISYILYYFSF